MNEERDQSAPDSSVDPGDSITRRGEDVGASDQEAGRKDTGTQGPTDRPTGTSTARDATSVDPQDPITGSPAQGGQGG